MATGGPVLEVESLDRPFSLTEVTELFSRVRDPDVDLALYAGGTELLQAAKLGMTDVRHLVDLKGVRELHGVVVGADELVLGAASTYHQVCTSEQVREHAPALAVVCAGVANPRVRSVGTLGGNLCFGDPHSDLASFVVACGATADIWSGTGLVNRALDGFWSGPYQPELDTGDVLVAIRLPVGPDIVVEHTRHAIRERPCVTCTCFVRMDDSGVGDARLAIAAATFVPRLSGVAIADAFDDPGSGTIDELARVTAAEFEYVDDLDGPVEFKEQLAATIIGQTLERARRRVHRRTQE